MLVSISECDALKSSSISQGLWVDGLFEIIQVVLVKLKTEEFHAYVSSSLIFIFLNTIYQLLDIWSPQLLKTAIAM